MEKSYRNMAQRQINAENNFTSLVRRFAKCTPNEADRVLSYYRKHKIVKFTGDRYQVTHGLFFDKPLLEACIRITKREGV